KWPKQTIGELATRLLAISLKLLWPTRGGGGGGGGGGALNKVKYSQFQFGQFTVVDNWHGRADGPTGRV
ncbi:hypothetical protein ACMBCN_01330, partial [Candidatus Liberibacter asiaticus]|nr:hypothetical protein [Candidatus Liberibacter asiaticus]